MGGNSKPRNQAEYLIAFFSFQYKEFGFSQGEFILPVLLQQVRLRNSKGNKTSNDLQMLESYTVTPSKSFSSPTLAPTALRTH